MRVPRHFSIEDMPSRMRLELERANIRIKLVSSFLYAKNVPPFDITKSPQQDMYDLAAEMDLNDLFKGVFR